MIFKGFPSLRHLYCDAEGNLLAETMIMAICLNNVSYSLKNMNLDHSAMGSVLIPVVLIDRDGFLSR